MRVIDSPRHPGHPAGVAITDENFSLMRLRAEWITHSSTTHGTSLSEVTRTLYADQAVWAEGRAAAKAAARNARQNRKAAR